MIRCYKDLSAIESFRGRYEYLRIGGQVGDSTFGFDRYLNQEFYRSREWRNARRSVIIRDNGCDLGVDGYEMQSGIVIHHMNPISIDDIVSRNVDIFNPEYLICVSNRTHMAIHYGDESLLPKVSTGRLPGDTCPWRLT